MSCKNIEKKVLPTQTQLFNIEEVPGQNMESLEDWELSAHNTETRCLEF